MYKSSLRHIHDPVLSSLKMKGMRFFLFVTSLHYYLQTNFHKEPSYSILAVSHFHLNYKRIARSVNRSEVRSHDELPKIADRWC
jgi:hypothetical protein